MVLVFSVQINLYFAPLLAFGERYYINFLISAAEGGGRTTVSRMRWHLKKKKRKREKELSWLIFKKQNCCNKNNPSYHINTRLPGLINWDVISGIVSDFNDIQTPVTSSLSHVDTLFERKKTKPETYNPLAHKICSNTINTLKLRNLWPKLWETVGNWNSVYRNSNKEWFYEIKFLLSTYAKYFFLCLYTFTLALSYLEFTCKCYILAYKVLLTPILPKS